MRGVSDDARFVLTTGSDGVFRHDLEAGGRARVDINADGTPFASTTSWAWLSADGSKALTMRFDSETSEWQAVIRHISPGFSTVYRLPKRTTTCGTHYGSINIEDVTPDLSAILVQHHFGGCNPIGTHSTYHFATDGTAQRTEQLTDNKFRGELNDGATDLYLAAGACRPDAMFCSSLFGGIDRTVVERKPLKSEWTYNIRSDVDNAGDGYASWTGSGTVFAYGSRLKSLDRGTGAQQSEPFALYRGTTATGDLRYLAGAAGPPIRIDRAGRFILSTTTVTSTGGASARHHSIVDAWSPGAPVRVLDLEAGGWSQDLETGDLNGAAIDRDLRYAFRVRDVAGTPTLQRIPLVGTSTSACTAGDTNCDGIVRIAILGDSYISGEGAADGIDAREPPIESAQSYHACTDIANGECGRASDSRPFENSCHRSDASWAMRVAKRISSGSNILFAACSGAKTSDILDHGQYDGQVDRNGPSPPAVFGGKPQLEVLKDFDAEGRADLVLLSIGGNDIGFGPVITRCIVSSCLVWPASGWKGDAQYAARHIDERVAHTIDRIRDAAKRARVVIVGYPDPTKIAQCGSTGWGTSLASIDMAEQQWLRDEFIVPLNDSLKRAASSAGATFVPFVWALSGHEICSDLPYVHGLKAGSEKLGIGVESFHPNAFGHRRLAEIAESPIRDLDGMLDRKATIPVTVANPRSELKVTVGGSSTAQASPGSTVTLQGAGAPPSGSGVVVLNSLPTRVGIWSADANGAWVSTFVVPATTGPGVHRVAAFDSVTGEDFASAEFAVDTRATCPPDSSAADADGDGLPDRCDPAPFDGPAADVDDDGSPNATDNCPMVFNPEQWDHDLNGLGNACDPRAGGSLDLALRAAGNVPPHPPTLTLDGRQASDPQATIAIVGSDPDDPDDRLTHRCSIDGGPTTPCGSPLTTWEAPGEHRVEVTTRDPAGNESTPATVRWNVEVQTWQPPLSTSPWPPAPFVPSRPRLGPPPTLIGPRLAPSQQSKQTSFPYGLADVELRPDNKLAVPVACSAHPASRCSAKVAARFVRSKSSSVSITVPAGHAQLVLVPVPRSALRKASRRTTLSMVEAGATTTPTALVVNMRRLPQDLRAQHGRVRLPVLVPGGARATRATLTLRVGSRRLRTTFRPTPGRVQYVTVRGIASGPIRAVARFTYADSVGKPRRVSRTIRIRPHH